MKWYKNKIIWAGLALLIIYYLYKKFKPVNYATIAKKYGLEPAHIYAIAQVESGGNGYLPDGRPKILFERHVFWQQLQKLGIDPNQYTQGNSDILSPSAGNYGKGGVYQWERLNRAIAINKEAALKSASWGEFQIMGFNYEKAGYKSVESFVYAMKHPNPDTNINAVMSFIQKKGLIDNLQKNDFAGFAYGYNGAGYARNQYDIKLQNAYQSFKNKA